jgi:hypothetical protein
MKLKMKMKTDVEQLIDLCEQEYQKREKTGHHVTTLGYKPEARATQIRTVIELLAQYIVIREDAKILQCPRCEKYCDYDGGNIWKCPICALKMELP